MPHDAIPGLSFLTVLPCYHPPQLGPVIPSKHTWPAHYNRLPKAPNAGHLNWQSTHLGSCTKCSPEHGCPLHGMTLCPLSVFLLTDEIVGDSGCRVPSPLPSLGRLPQYCTGTRSDQHPSDSIVPGPPAKNRKSGILAFCKVVNPASKRRAKSISVPEDVILDRHIIVKHSWLGAPCEPAVDEIRLSSSPPLTRYYDRLALIITLTILSRYDRRTDGHAGYYMNAESSSAPLWCPGWTRPLVRDSSSQAQLDPIVTWRHRPERSVRNLSNATAAEKLVVVPLTVSCLPIWSNNSFVSYISLVTACSCVAACQTPYSDGWARINVLHDLMRGEQDTPANVKTAAMAGLGADCNIAACAAPSTISQTSRRRTSQGAVYTTDSPAAAGHLLMKACSGQRARLATTQSAPHPIGSTMTTYDLGPVAAGGNISTSCLRGDS
ncbi:hypothetical protein B0J13DRAFT_519443 [Dactylonectria estremocensis]|uniref:Uncharacterized protein n=1 Tax=Dactylonectria estremocensis TaxID=1079267 RepID=A0A9P9JIC3_9HYPO|nr:hypothetical protein B0J13DRAFT_519443 [Dactylonectria estremocensis]